MLGGLGELPRMVVAASLSAFDDDAAITYLSTLVPGFGDSLRWVVGPTLLPGTCFALL